MLHYVLIHKAVSVAFENTHLAHSRDHIILYFSQQVAIYSYTATVASLYRIDHLSIEYPGMVSQFYSQ